MPSNETPSGQDAVQWAKFLAEASLWESQPVIGLTAFVEHQGPVLQKPSLSLHCSSPECGGDHFFDCQDAYRSHVLNPGTLRDVSLYYTCRHCRRSQKVYMVRVKHSSSGKGEALKIGEYPPTVPETSRATLALVEEHKDVYFKGRRAENQNLGMGAYAYYRRIVEELRGKLFDALIETGKRLRVDPQVLKTLGDAREERQFRKSLEMAKDVLPASLLVDNHNPLAVLHEATSKGLHELTDVECMARARVIRLVLIALAERHRAVLREELELRQAIGQLTRDTSP